MKFVLVSSAIIGLLVIFQLICHQAINVKPNEQDNELANELAKIAIEKAYEEGMKLLPDTILARQELDGYSDKFSEYYLKYLRLICNITKLAKEAKKRTELDCKYNLTLDCFPPNCTVALNKTGKSGVYLIKVPGAEIKPFYAYCLNDSDITSDTTTTNAVPAWTVIQRIRNAKINFSRSWDEYKNGFGNLNDTFFLGLEKIHALTHAKKHELWIELEDAQCVVYWAKYSSFVVGNEDTNYALIALGNYTGNTGDSFSYHGGQMWSTPDRDNDDDDNEHCAQTYESGWWYHSCFQSNLNGGYLRNNDVKQKIFHGIIWKTISDYSLIASQMAIRPVE